MGLRSASSMSSEVDLPAPFGPSRATVSPGRKSRVSPSTALRRPYCLDTFSNETTGVPPLPRQEPLAVAVTVSYWLM